MANKTTTKKSTSSYSSKNNRNVKNNEKARAISENKDKSQSSRNNQAISIILFALSALLFCLVLISGESAWNFMHKFIWGLFGNVSILWPVLLSYVSIAIAFEKPMQKVSFKIWFTVITIVLICSSVYIFSADNKMGISYWHQLKNLYVQGALGEKAGLFSGLFGIPIAYIFGSTGSKIVIIILIFVSLMFLTGTSLVQLFAFFRKPVDLVKQNAMSKEDLSLEQDKRKSLKIDIPIDDNGLPEHPVKSVLTNADLNKHNEKLERLKESFSDKKLANTKEKSNFSSLEGDSVAVAANAFIEKQKRDKLALKNKQSIDIEIDDLSNDESYKYPPIQLLEESAILNETDIADELKNNGQMLVDTLKSFNVQTKIVDISRGPAVTRYELQPAAGVKISKITSLADDIALNLAACGVRIEAPIPGKAAVGIEIPNKLVNVVKMRELIVSNKFAKSKGKLSVVLGKDIAGNVSVADLSKMPHLLIAGSTGSGKSVCINSFIISLLYKSTPNDVRLLMIDPKVVELGVYNGIPHLLVPVVTDPRKAAGALNWAVNEMLNRYKIFAEHNVRDLQSYNKMVMSMMKSGSMQDEELHTLPQIVIIIDELADLMMAAPNEVEDAICRLAQMARAAGMHLVIATQRPSVDVITGIIKANIPSRIALAVSSQVDSRTILDMGGAEKLLGRGDMLFAPVGSSKPLRIQGCYVTDEEIERVIAFIKTSQNSEYDQNVIEEIEKNTVEGKNNSESSDNKESEDVMMPEAIKCVVEAGQASTSLLQRRLRLGYARAGRLIDEMEQMGIVGPHEGSKPRQVLITYKQWLEMNMQKSDN